MVDKMWAQYLLDTEEYNWMHPQYAEGLIAGVFFRAEEDSLRYEWMFTHKERLMGKTASQLRLENQLLGRNEVSVRREETVQSLQVKISARGRQPNLKHLLERTINQASKSEKRRLTIKQLNMTMLSKNARIKNLQDEIKHLNALLRGHQQREELNNG